MNSPLEDIRKIYQAGINAVSPYNAVLKNLHIKNNLLTINGTEKSFNVNDYTQIYVVGAGKATAAMARGIEELLGNHISSGVISVKYNYTEKLQIITQLEASHPLPDKNGVKAASKIIELVEKAGKNDLIISLISGGGSALIALPPHSISLEEKQLTTSSLLASGATIHDINCVRKHISLTKGGNLARSAYPATVLNLMISDVVGDDIDVIASGPFTADTSSFDDALSIIDKYSLSAVVPKSVTAYLTDGKNKIHPENELPDSACFSNVTNYIIASNITALKAAHAKASVLGYNSILLSSLFQGNTPDVVDFHIAIVKEIIASGNPAQRPACILSGGESGVIVRGKGRGGRNSEFALLCADKISGLDGVYAASIATDGSDGPTDAAGAVINWQTKAKALELGLNLDCFIADNNSYTFFTKTGELIKTGPTNTNVMDLHIVIVN